jgi:hypothetical protein
MNGKYIVNYYTGSVGDALIAHTFPNIIHEYEEDRKKYTTKNILNIKNPDIDIWKNSSYITNLVINYFNFNTVASIHRFESFDFLKIYPTCKVISINPSGLEKNIVERNDVMWGDRYPKMKSEFNKKIKKIREIKQWVKNNILQTDYVIDLQDLLKYKQEYFKDWQNTHKLFELQIPDDEFFNHAISVLNLDY